MDALRTPYRIDILQPLYYVLDSLETLHELSERDIMGMVHDAWRRGSSSRAFRPSHFPPDPTVTEAVGA